jgi:magnesium transporter
MLFWKQIRKKEPGTLPGVMNIDENAQKTKMSIITYSDKKFNEISNAGVEEIEVDPFLNGNEVRWIDIQGLGSEKIVKTVGKIYNLHPLTVEDIINLYQRPKVEKFDEYSYIVMKIIRNENGEIVQEQMSMIMIKNVIITFQEKYGDSFETIRERIRKSRGFIRKKGADYLMYSLIDNIIDNYFPVLEVLGISIENKEEILMENPMREELGDIYSYKQKFLSLKRDLWHIRELISSLLRDDTKLFSSATKIFIRDCYDHIIQEIDIVETYMELTTELMNLYLSSLSNKLNEIMKILTIISTVFIPLSFLTGLYGMNFINIPELKTENGYFILLIIMFFIASSMIFYFIRKGWITFKFLTVKNKKKKKWR